MSTPPSAGQTRRLTGVFKGVIVGEEADTELDFLDEDGLWLNNAFNAGTEMNSDTIDVTAFGDFPFKTNEAGFMDFSMSVSMRHKVENGKLAKDVEFMESHALQRKPFRMAIVDDRSSATPNGFVMTVIPMSSSNSGDFSASQDHEYSLSLTSGKLPPKRIVAGVATSLTIA